MKYYPMAMHLHSVHQPGASMESHIYNAHLLGMKYIRFTDHDTRMGRMSAPVCDFDFTRGALYYLDHKDEGRGWKVVENPSVTFENDALALSSPTGDRCGITFYSDGKRHARALLSDVTLNFAFDCSVGSSDKIIFDITLSQRPPEHKEAHFRYVIGEVSNAKTNLISEVAMPDSTDGVYRLNLSRDVREEINLGGLDNTFASVSIFVEGNAKVTLRKFEIEHKYECNDLILKQRALADEIGKKYGIKPFVTTEMSGCGQHKNCFSSFVPVINYCERGYNMTEEEAAEYLRSYGAVFSYNHPFEAKRYKRKAFTREEIERIIEYETETLANNRVYAATCMEVGFPVGRGLFSLADYLRLWDNLALRGVFVTGDGDSDSHYSDRSWFDANNFATWIAADDSLDFPISEQTFNASLLSGNCYMGDPVRIKGDVDFHAGEFSMGAVIRTYDSDYTVTLSLSDVKEGQTVRFIKDGAPFLTDTVYGLSYLRSITVTPDKSISFVRAELYDTDGRCIMLTNPIYFVEPGYRGEISPKRASYFGSSRQKNDLENITRTYNEVIRLPEWIDTAKGKKVLHIGDTESRRYYIYRELIDRIRPDVIIHTGDVCDEVKAGRMSEVGEEYAYKLRFMAEILRNSGAEIIIVPGNNDIAEEISKLLPTAAILKNNSTLVIDGVECRVGHEVYSMTFDKAWSFYGHGFTGDDWKPTKNREGDSLRFNACYGPTVCSLSDGKFYTYPIGDFKEE